MILLTYTFKLTFIPILIIVTGILVILKIPYLFKNSKINDFFLELASTFKKDQESWNVAQQRLGKFLLISGCLLLIFSPMPMNCVQDSDKNTIWQVEERILELQSVLIPLLLMLILERNPNKKNENNKNSRRRSKIYRDKSSRM